MTYDIIIAGAGPSGMMAASAAASKGLSVLLVDTKEHITRYTRPCCSMWLLEPGFHNEAWTFKENKIFFHRNDFSIPYYGGIVDLHRSVRLSSTGHSMVMGKRLTPIARVIDKQKLLEGLFADVEKSGVEIRSKTTCIGIEESKSCVKAKIRHKDSVEWVTGKYLLAADGVDSKIVQSMGLNDKRKMFIRTPVLNYYFAGVKTPYPDSWLQFVGDGFNGVSGSFLHKPDRDGYKDIYEIGALPLFGSGIGYKDAMERLLAHPVLREWLKEAHLIKKVGCRWTCWAPISSPARGRVIITGDAASFQEVENQGAIMCGFKAAQAVLKTENGEDGFKEYNQFWQDFFEFNDPEILKDTWKGFIFRFIGGKNIDYILSLSDGKMLDGYINHFKSGNTIFEFINSQLPMIKKDRPDLAEKIIKFKKFNLEEHMIGDVNA
jgi:flavin-dependent dehydrogenase